jgi:hypothetical protein
MKTLESLVHTTLTELSNLEKITQTCAYNPRLFKNNFTTRQHAYLEIKELTDFVKKVQSEISLYNTVSTLQPI